MDLDLRTLFPLEPGQTDALDSFIGHRLFEASVWESPRQSDGVQRVRVIEHKPERVRICGRIYEIDQTLHSFWMQLDAAAGGLTVTWALYYDVVAVSARRERNAIDTYDDANDIDWRIALAGDAEVRAGALVVVPTNRVQPV